MSSSYRHTCLLDTEPSNKLSLKCWGDDNFDKTTYPQYKKNHSAKQVIAGMQSTCLIINRGELYCWGNAHFGQSSIPSSLKQDVKEVSLLASHTCAIKFDNELICFGDNEENQSYVPPHLSRNDSLRTVQVGFMHNCVLIGDYTVECWGSNALAQLDIPDIIKSRHKTINIIKAGLYHTCVVTDWIYLNCFGYNVYGIFDYPYEKYKMKPFIRDVSLGIYHICITRYFNNVSCWGKIGKSYFDYDWFKDVYKFVSGESHNCIIRNLENFEMKKNSIYLKCLGENEFGQLNVPNNGILNDKFWLEKIH